MFKINLLMTNIFNASQSAEQSFSTDISNVEIYAFDVTVDDDANFVTQNIGSSYMGKYPPPTADEFNEISHDTADKIVYQDGDYAKVLTKTIDVGGRDWTIYCCIEDKYISEKRSALPFFIGALSVGITIIFNLFRMVLNCCMSRAQSTITRQHTKDNVKV